MKRNIVSVRNILRIQPRIPKRGQLESTDIICHDMNRDLLIQIHLKLSKYLRQGKAVRLALPVCPASAEYEWLPTELEHCIQISALVP